LLAGIEATDCALSSVCLSASAADVGLGCACANGHGEVDASDVGRQLRRELRASTASFITSCGTTPRSEDRRSSPS
jgi:hypothetical protein